MLFKLIQIGPLWVIYLIRTFELRSAPGQVKVRWLISGPHRPKQTHGPLILNTFSMDILKIKLFIKLIDAYFLAKNCNINKVTFFFKSCTYFLFKLEFERTTMIKNMLYNSVYNSSFLPGLNWFSSSFGWRWGLLNSYIWCYNFICI